MFEEWRNLECTGEKSECGRYDRGRRYVKRCICPAESKRSGYGDSTSVCECGSQLIHRKFGAQSGMPMAQEVEEELENWEEEHETTGDFKQ